MANRFNNPFKGLQSYELEDKDRLFGRDKDLVLIKDRIFSARTTLLFAGSGVGKTSFLNAKVIPALSHSFFIFYFKEWAAKGEPLYAIKRALGEQLKTSEDLTSKSLRSILERFKESNASDRSDEQTVNRCLILFDQFEEIFQYHSYGEYFDKFIEELCEVINANDLQSRVIFSMREEFLGELSVFDNRIPDLFNNYYRLKYPDKPEAGAIIANTSLLAGIKVDKEGLKTLVADLSEIERGGGGFAERGANEKDSKTSLIKRDFIVPPYLQIACRGLWDRQFGAGQNGEAKSQVFLSDYKEKEARSILIHFCNGKLSSLSFGEQFVAARAFNFLVTKQGAKMAYELTRLSEHMIVSKKKLKRTLEKLSSPETRILRESRGPDGSRWFELYHDIYGTIVDEWKQKITSRIWKLGMMAAAVFFVFLFFLITYFLPNWYYNPREYIKTLETETVTYTDANNAYLKLRETFGYEGKAVALWARYWERRALQEEFQQNRDKALLCWLQALKAEPDGETAGKRRLKAGQLAGTDYQSIIATFQYSSRATKPFISADGSAVLTQDADRAVSLWNSHTGDPIIQQLSLDRTQREPSKFRSYASRSGVSSSILKAAVHHDRFKFLIAGINDDEDNLFVWRADTGKMLSVFNISKAIKRGFSESIELAFSPDGKYLAAGGEFHKPQVWRLSDAGATPEKQITQKNGASGLAFSPDGKRLLTTDGKAIRLWNFESSSERVKIIPLTKEAFTVAFSPDGTTFLVRYRDESVQVWLAASAQPTGMVIKPYKSLPGSHAAIGPDNRTVIVNRIDGRIESWDSQTGKSTGFIKRQASDTTYDYRDLLWSTFHPDGENILVRDADGISRMIRLDTRMPETDVIKVDDNILVSDLSSDGKIITTLSSAEKAQVWSTDTMEPLGAPIDLRTSVAKRPDGTADKIKPPLAFSSNGESVIKIGPDFFIKIWQVSTGKQISDKEIPMKEFFKEMADKELSQARRFSFTFSPDDRFLTINHQITSRSILFDTYKVNPITNVYASTHAFSQDGKYFAQATYGNDLIVWNLSEQSEASLNKADLSAGRITSLDFGGDKLVTASDNTAQVWDLTTGNVISRIKERKGNRILALTISPDLKRVLTGSITGVVSLWDITNRDAQQLGGSADLNSSVDTIKVSDDGTTFVVYASSWAYLFSIEDDGIHYRSLRLLSASSDGRFIIWDGPRPTIRLVSQITADRIKVDNIDFSERDIIPLEGEPSDLWEQWETKCALTIDKNGDFVPLYQSSNGTAGEEKESDR